MSVEEFKEAVKKILELEIKFDGHCNQIINNVSDERRISILKWIKECHAGITRPEPCKNFRHLLSFIYKSNDNKIRGILTKEKNSYFIELFLDKHKYYDLKRRYLGL